MWKPSSMGTNVEASRGRQAVLVSVRHGVSFTEKATAKSTTLCVHSVSDRSVVDNRSNTYLASASGRLRPSSVNVHSLGPTNNRPRQ